MMNCSVRKHIRDGHPDFIVTADSWPAYLYPFAQAGQDEIEHGLFKSAILLKVSTIYRNIYLFPITFRIGF